VLSGTLHIGDEIDEINGCSVDGQSLDSLQSLLVCAASQSTPSITGVVLGGARGTHTLHCLKWGYCTDTFGSGIHTS